MNVRHRELVAAFVDAARSGDVDALMHLLAHDVRFVADGGGKVPAALNVIEGADRTARFVAGAVRNGLAAGVTLRFTAINGVPGLIIHGADGSVQSTAFEIDGDRIRAIYVVRNPDKLRHVTPSA